ncbi:MAG: ExbD/TolR family protein [Phycisphaerales bacterium]
MKLPRAKEMERERFDLTAMIDIVLLLIIFFTLTAQFASATRSRLDLPAERGRETPPDASSSVVVDMDRAGRLTVLGTQMTQEDLVESIRARPGGGSGGGGAGSGSGSAFDLIIRADQACPAVHMNRLATALARLGVRRWRLATKGEDAPPAPGGGGPS